MTSLAVKVQISLGVVLLVGLIAMASGFDIVPKDPETQKLFYRIIDAIFIVLNVPLIASIMQKKEKPNEQTDTAGDAPPAS